VLAGPSGLGHTRFDRMFGRLLVLSVVTSIVLVALRFLHKPLWDRRPLRWAPVFFALVACFGMVLREAGLGKLGESLRSPGATKIGALLGGGGAILLLSLFLTLPFGGLVRAIGSRLLRERTAPAPDASADVEAGSAASLPAPVAGPGPAPVLTRRTVLEAAALALPAAGVGLGAVGIAGAFVPTAIVPRKMTFATLPEELRGLKILQLTDVHLGAFMDPSGVADIVERAREHRPDLVVLTGDICDHLPWLEASLRAVETLDPRLGIFAVMGNHEHYRGALATRRTYAKTRIELLDDAHRVLQVGGSKLVVSGVDDPVGSRQRRDHTYERAIDTALSGAPSDAFHLGLCHRPKGFGALASRGVDLTLSGHTHGAQLGAGDRSLLEPFAEGAYLWGDYELGDKRLYTSSGAGHWLAFRLDCPSEAALVTLEKA
jgi:hypothetical protein